MSPESTLSYNERLATFIGYWDECPGTFQQLAAIGHICDRPPLEALEQGSHCISCIAFVKKEVSVQALEGPVLADSFANGLSFHYPSCTRLQVRIPLEPQSIMPGLYGGSIISEIRRWERRIHAKPRGDAAGTKRKQYSSLFSLPTELRLLIYSMILPTLDRVTPVVPLNSDSARVVTKMGFEKTGPRDLTKCNLLRTCRAVHEEALDLLFSNITYRFACTKTLYLFLRHIGQNGRQLLKSVDVHCGSREDAVAFALLASCEQMRHIVIRLPRPKLFYQRAPLWSLDGATSMLNLSGLKTVEFKGLKKAESASTTPITFRYMDDDMPDAASIRKELTRPRGSAMCIGDLKEHLNLD